MDGWSSMAETDATRELIRTHPDREDDTVTTAPTPPTDTPSDRLPVRSKRPPQLHPQHPIRAPKDEWHEFVAQVKAQDLNVSDVTRRLWRAWVAGDIELPA